MVYERFHELAARRHHLPERRKGAVNLQSQHNNSSGDMALLVMLQPLIDVDPEP